MYLYQCTSAWNLQRKNHGPFTIPRIRELFTLLQQHIDCGTEFKDKCLVYYSWSVPIEGDEKQSVKKKKSGDTPVLHKAQNILLFPFFCDTMKLEKKYYFSCLRDLSLKWIAEHIQTIWPRSLLKVLSSNQDPDFTKFWLSFHIQSIIRMNPFQVWLSKAQSKPSNYRSKRKNTR